MDPDPTGTLHSPGPLLPPLGQPQHLAVPVVVIADLQRRLLILVPVEHRHR